jgi:hypothetical protein
MELNGHSLWGWGLWDSPFHISQTILRWRCPRPSELFLLMHLLCATGGPSAGLMASLPGSHSHLVGEEPKAQREEQLIQAIEPGL